MPVYQPDPFSLPTTSGVPLTGAELTALINIRLSALLASHTGPSRPTYAIPGTLWRNSIDNEIYYFDGTSDTPIIQSIDLLNNTADAVAQGAVVPVGALTLVGNQYTAPAFSGPFATIPLAANRSFITSIPAGGENIATDPTIVVGGLTLTIKDQKGDALPVGGLVSGTTYLFRVVTSTIVRILGSSTKSSLGLANVDNTSDLAKPLSTLGKSTIEQGSIIPVSMLVFAANQYTAPALTAPFDFITPAPGQVFHIRIPAGGANTAPAPTLVLGGLTLTLLGESLEALATGDMKANSSYLIYVKTSTQAVIIGLTRQSVIDLKAPSASPTLTGVPTAPTASAGTNTTQIATTAFATTALALKANTASPTFTGTVNGITKSMVGLGNVDNTTDLLKPLSTAAQTLAAKGSVIKLGTLTYVGNQYTAPALAAPFDFITPASDQDFYMLIPSGASNIAADPTLVVGGLTFAIKDQKGAALAAGDLVVGSGYLLRTTTSAIARVVGAINKAGVGLTNVDNTSDLTKPIQTAIQNVALDSLLIKPVSVSYNSGTNIYTLILSDLYKSSYNLNILSDGIMFLFTVPATNVLTKPSVLLGAASVIASRLVDHDGNDLAAGQLVPGELYLFEKTPIGLRIRASSQAYSDLQFTKTESSDNAATLVSGVARVAQQLLATLPTRPAADIVHWQTWSDPTTVMEDQDLWFSIPLPSVPEAPVIDGKLWKLVDSRTGTTADILLNGISQTRVPRISGINARVGIAGAVQPLGNVFSGRFPITGLTLGATEQIYLQYENYLGGGLWSEPRELIASTGEFLDTLTTELGALHERDNWEIFTQMGPPAYAKSMNVTVNGATALAANTTNYAVCACPFTANHYAQVNLTWNTASITYLYYAGVQVRSTILPSGIGIPDGIILLASQNTWQLLGYLNQVSTVLLSGTLGTFPTTIRLDVVGNIYTGFVNGVQVGQYTDTLNTYPATGSTGLRTTYPGASQPVTNLYLTNFRAGDL